MRPGFICRAKESLTRKGCTSPSKIISIFKCTELPKKVRKTPGTTRGNATSKTWLMVTVLHGKTCTSSTQEMWIGTSKNVNQRPSRDSSKKPLHCFKSQTSSRSSKIQKLRALFVRSLGSTESSFTTRIALRTCRVYATTLGRRTLLAQTAPFASNLTQFLSKNYLPPGCKRKIRIGDRKRTILGKSQLWKRRNSSYADS